MENKKNNTSYGQCRCCLTKGNHRDIMKEYYSNGIREVYFDIFMECFNLFLSTDTNLSTLICASCVQRLKDASSFRMLAVSTEQQLLDAVRGDRKRTIFVNVPVEDRLGCDLDLKTEQHFDVKLEPSDTDTENVMDCMDFDPDYIPEDYQARESKLCSKIDRTEIVEGEADLLARFPPGKLKPLPTRRTLQTILPNFVRHLNLLKETVIAPKTLRRLLEENDIRRQPFNSKQVYVTEKMAHIINASTLLEYSNLTPFRSKGRLGFPCFYCKSLFENIDSLKEHTREHKHSEIVTILRTFGAESLVVYADINNLACKICNESLPNLNELKSHLTKIHKKKMHLELSDRVIPFKLSKDLYECQVCGFNFETFGAIERHMNVHFRNYVCKDCGTGFVTKYRLKVHIKSMHVDGTFPCEICGKIFKTQQKHKNHVNTVHKLVKRFKCTTCPERFTEYFSRQKHMVEAHGVAPLQYKCNVCEKSFDRRYTLSRHLKRDHLEERDFQCELCSYKCFTNNELRVHMVKHNGERIFECSVCKKSYARKKTLKEHMRIHNNDRRFACAVCGQAFVQKCSLKGHLKTHHVEFSMT